jgi:hypothetical protein
MDAAVLERALVRLKGSSKRLRRLYWLAYEQYICDRAEYALCKIFRCGDVGLRNRREALFRWLHNYLNT